MSDLSAFVEKHLGCGDVNSPIWFVGPEPAGSGTEADVTVRTNSFVAQGSLPITNLRRDLLALGETQYFIGERPKIQKYWAVISRLWLSAQGCTPNSTDNIRWFQQHVLCGHYQNQGPLLLETSALPSPSTGQWPYTWDHGIAELESRRTYEAIISARLKRINDLIDEYRPKLVLLMGTTYTKRWLPIQKAAPSNVKVLVLPHPNTRPTLKNADWDSIGKGLQEHL